MILSYPDYSVEKIESFYDLFRRIEKFGSYTAFINRDSEISYGRFCEDIRRTISSFQNQRNFVLLNCKDKYNFVVAFFAIILSDNIACLQPADKDLLPCYEKFNFSHTVDDCFVTRAISGEIVEKFPITDKGNICTVLCSSGTTATPKAVALSQYNIISDLIAGMEKYEFQENGRYVNILPYSHSFGIVCDLLGPLYSCSTIAFSYSPTEFFSLLPTVNPTALNIIPALVDVFAKQMSMVPHKELIVGRSLTKILSGGAGTPAALCTIMHEYGIEIYGCYGLTECAPCVSVNRDQANKYGSAGVSLNCNTVTVKENGAISICGTNVMKGYLDEFGNCISVDDNTFDSGDIGYFDEDGYLYIVGRQDDMIVFSNGTKLMPSTVEAKINSVPEVVESLVYAKGDKLYAQVIVQKKEIIDEVRKALLSNTFDVHKLYDVNCTTEPLIRNAMGKIDRKRVKE